MKNRLILGTVLILFASLLFSSCGKKSSEVTNDATKSQTNVVADIKKSETKNQTGDEWIQVDTDCSILEGVIWDGNKFIAVGGPGNFAASTDGVNWVSKKIKEEYCVTAIAYSGKNYVVVGLNGYAAVSADCENWKMCNFEKPFFKHINTVIWANNQFVMGGNSGFIETSVDGVTWKNAETGVPNDIMKITYGNNQYVAVGSGGIILTSPDGIKWEKRNLGKDAIIRSLVFHDNKYIAVGQFSLIATSKDGINWSIDRYQEGTPFYIDIIWNGKQYVIVGGNGNIVTSSDSINWLTERDGGNHIMGIACNDNIMVATQYSSGSILTKKLDN